MNRCEEQMRRNPRVEIPAAQAEMKGFIPAVRPIFTVDGRERPDAHGSCVLLRVGDRHFALSAAHVFDSMEENELYIAGETHLLSLPRNWHGTPMPGSGKREDDKID